MMCIKDKYFEKEYRFEPLILQMNDSLQNNKIDVEIFDFYNLLCDKVHFSYFT